jgi:hypothetical protein
MLFYINISNLTAVSSGTSQIKDMGGNNINIKSILIDSANNNPNEGDPTVLTSTWINASALPNPSFPEIGNANFNTTTTYKVYNALQPTKLSWVSGILKFQPSWPTITPNSKNVILYLRIGLHQNSTAKLTNVTASYNQPYVP